MENKIRTRNMDGNKPDTEGGSSRVIGQAAAWFTILLWGTTFVSIKILLEEFNPAEILLFRFIMGSVSGLPASIENNRYPPGDNICFSRP